MGKGIDKARDNNPLHAQVIDDFKDQLLIILVKRLGGKIIIPIKETDDTGNNNLLLAVRDGNFILEVGTKDN